MKSTKKEKSSKFIVKYTSGDGNRTYREHAVTIEGGIYKCLCCTRMGYPCRHIFAVVLNNPSLKISLKNVNTRFYVKTDYSKIDDENRKAAESLQEYISKDKDNQQNYPICERIAGVRRNIRNEIDV